MTLPTRFAAIAAAALCLAAAPAAFAQDATTNGSSGTMSVEHGKDAMSHSGRMMSTKAKKSSMAQSGMTQTGMTDHGAMSHSGDKMD
ncbi:MAG: hypothetical protein JO157_09505, partial [Acetobacteraceae bacterium]|nr:hypothetical protein [Acetobacteraceae bacterium]